MDPSTTLAVSTAGAVITGVSTITGAWLKARAQVRRDRELSRRQYVRSLPAGSRIIDCGERGILIEVGEQNGGAGGQR